MNQTKIMKDYLFPVVERSVIVQALWVSSFAAMTAIGAQIEIPHYPVPYTMQTFVVLLSGAMLGKKNAALSQVLYLFLGAIGLPVFSQLGFGIAKLFGPTGGYLLSFPVAAFAVGYIIDKNRSFWWSALSMVIGALIIFSLGTLQLNIVYYRDWEQAFVNGFLIFSWWDVVKLVSAASVAYSLRRM